MENKAWNPAELLQLSGGYWSASALHAAVALDVFTHLAQEALTAEDLSGRVTSDARGLKMLLNAVVALGLLEKKGDCFSATPFSCQFLSRSAPGYLGHIILHHHHLMDSWAHLDEAVRRGGAVRQSASHDADVRTRESFLMGMFNLAMLLAPGIVSGIDLTGCRRLLDLGGGPGTYAIQFCLHNPELEAVIFDLPTTRPFAEETVERFGLSGRITFSGGDFDVASLPGGFDVAWLSHILHSEGPDACGALLAKTVAALEPGGMVYVQEFILDDTHDGPLFPALFSLNMLLGTPAGQAYSEGELITMMERAGLRDVRRLRLDLPNGAGVIAGRAPDASGVTLPDDSLHHFCRQLEEHLAAAAGHPDALVEKAAQDIGAFFDVAPHEVALFVVDAVRHAIAFCWPRGLAVAGTIPLKAVNSTVATTVNEGRSFLDNQFAATRHLYMFEHLLANREERIPVQKILSVPVRVGGTVRGVVQVARKGNTPAEAGEDFTLDDLASLDRIASVLGPYLVLIEGVKDSKR